MGREEEVERICRIVAEEMSESQARVVPRARAPDEAYPDWKMAWRRKRREEEQILWEQTMLIPNCWRRARSKRRRSQ